MRTGKLESNQLENLLAKYTGFVRDDVVSGGKLGEDCSFIKMGTRTLALTTDPVTAAKSNIGKIGFNININDLATSGAEGIGLLVTVLMPPGTELFELETIMGDLHQEALDKGLQILGGHTEVTDAVNRIIISVTAVGATDAGEEIKAGDARVGDYFVVSKWLGIEGTYIVASDFEDKLGGELSEAELAWALSLGESLSVLREGLIGKQAGVHAMHDITEGGVLGALWEVSRASGLGCEIMEASIPVHPVTQKICRILQLDPLRLISSGSMLFATASPEKLLHGLKAAGIAGTIIGRVTKSGFRMVDQTGIRDIEPPMRDEIYGLFE